jgi:putative hydrolase of the HAD superfamily
MSIRAVFFDVDFTLIYPGPTFQGEGYQAFCARHGMTADPAKFAQAVVSAGPLLDGHVEALYDAEIFVAYTRHIIETMGGVGEAVDRCAREIYAEWASNHHFALYDDVPAALRELADAGLRIGLISNSHRCLASFQEHFELRPLISGAVSSSEHGFMKPHASIFRAAMQLVDVAPEESVMVGDSAGQDIDGALNAGMRAVLLHRNADMHPRARELAAAGVPTIHSLVELSSALASLSNAPVRCF